MANKYSLSSLLVADWHGSDIASLSTRYFRQLPKNARIRSLWSSITTFLIAPANVLSPIIAQSLE